MEPASRSRSVPFRGDGAGSYPLSWSQRWIWRAVCLNAPDIQHLCITITVPVPPGRDVDAALEAASVLLARHQALRTSFHIDQDGEPRQVVVGRGETVVRIYDMGESDPQEILRRLAHELASAPFTVSELTARLLVATVNDTPTHIILAVSHLATDAWAARRIKDDLAWIMAGTGEDKARRQRKIVQLSDRVAYENSADGARHSERSIRYWEEQTSHFPLRDYLPSRNVPEQPRFREVLMHSEAVGTACQLLCSSLHVGMPAVFIGLTAVLLSERSGSQRASFLVFCHNRLTPTTSALSGPLVQNFPLSVEVGERRVSELLRAVHSRVTEGAFSAQYDPVDLSAMLNDLTKRRGISPDLSYAVNIHTNTSSALRNMNELSGPAARDDLSTLTQSTKLSDGPAMEHEDMNFYLTAKHRGSQGLVTLRANTEYLSKSDICEFLGDLEGLSVAWADQVR